MNPGRVTPIGSPTETTRQLISDWNVKVLADAYDYDVVLPSSLDTMYATLDSETGSLLVQGGLNSLGQSQTDDIDIDVVGANIRVQVNGTTEFFPAADVTQIVVAPNGGSDSIFWDTTPLAALGLSYKEVGYVVSSNEDSADRGTQNDGLVDHDSAVPGRQTSLRGAIVDINDSSGAGSSVYVPRGNYVLELSGTGDDHEGDIDINKNIIVIGSGAGATVIDASQLATRDRIFEVKSTGSLDLSRVTLTGGQAAERGGAIRVNENSSIGGRELTLREVAIVGNTVVDHTTGYGGGVYFASNAEGYIYRSVITDNTAQVNSGGGGVYISGSNGDGATGKILLTQTVIAGNHTPNGAA